MRYFKLTVAYNGTRYSGWQLQAGENLSIQAMLESAVAELTGKHVRVVGSGRTDAGVHAIGQVASFGTDRWQAEARRFVPALNRFLPRDIVVRNCVEEKIRFHAIRDSIGKRYQYTIRAAPVRDPIQESFQWWFLRPLDVSAMQLASQRLIGEHDFACFQGKGSPRKSTVRNIHRLDIVTTPTWDGTIITVDIAANGFLYNMVRNIVGTLVDVGEGKRSPAWIDQLLASRDRAEAGQTAPAQGLCLVEVYY